MKSSISVDYGPWAAMRLRDGASVESIDTGRLSGHWLEWLGVSRALNGADRRAAFQEWTRHHPAGKVIVQQVLAVPANLIEYPEPTPDAQVNGDVFVQVPELPKKARLTGRMEKAATDTGEFVDDYCAHAAQIVNTLPVEMSEAAALAVVSIAVARRLRIAVWYERAAFPVIWALWIARSTVFGKTTGLNIARWLIRATMPHLLLPEEASGDRLIQEMAGMEPTNFKDLMPGDKERWLQAKKFAGQRGLVIDEASSLFNGFRKDYNVGKVETLLKAFDCEDEKVHSTVKHGSIYLRHLYMPLLGATTPAAIQQSANVHMWHLGFWPRFVLLVPEHLPDDPQFYEEPIPRPATLDRAILRLLEALPKPASAVEFGEEAKPAAHLDVTPRGEVFKHWTEYMLVTRNEWQKDGTLTDERLQAAYGRLPAKIWTVATLLAALDWNGKGVPDIKLCHYARAHQTVERWRANLHRFVTMMDQPLSGEDREKRLLAAIDFLQQRGTPTTARELHRLTHWPREQVDALLMQMATDGLIEPDDSATKRTKVWRVVA